MYELDYEIPIVDSNLLSTSYFDMPLDETAPLHDEPMVKLADNGILCQSYYARSDGNNPPYNQMIQGSDNDGWLRQSLTQKLVLVNQRLSVFGVQLIILDAFRSIECQRGLWAFYHQQYAQNNPQATASQCQQYAAKFVQDINNFNPLEPNRCPAHMTGASIDATLCHLGSGELLDMGTDFEQQVAQSRTDYFERQLQAGMIDDNDLRLNNRRLMHWAFSQEGILNDPALFWHHDWGNQLWFKTCKALTLAPPTAAWYGFAQLNQ